MESPDGKFYYGLYSDFSIGDPGFMVLKLDKKLNPKELKIDYSLKNGISDKDAEWMRTREIFYNYDEAGYFCDNPKLEFINNRFLVFSRGGYMFSLYDIKIEKDTFNIGSPWNEWYSQSQLTDESSNREKEKQDYGRWIQQNLHNKIKEYILTNK
ncbi:hypothetical protein [Adhaeribacter arboris]|uniref:hypothetical protein n=1 Tax=Adhaeribacter arboris TaxID=2072846 RepID=UPI0011B22DBF|nr:hypothetical protein [Adhaeribacter arboris]